MMVHLFWALSASENNFWKFKGQNTLLPGPPKSKGLHCGAVQKLLALQHLYQNFN